MKLTHYVFVYGTLKRGHGNNIVINPDRYGDERIGAEFISEAQTVEDFPLLVQGLPYLIDHPGKGLRVSGELYKVSNKMLTGPLDRLEGHPHFYKRRKIDVEFKHGTIKAWAYFLQRPMSYGLGDCHKSYGGHVGRW